MSLIFVNNIDGPATHAIVIGVGAYRHLVGGDRKLFPNHQGLGQLTSPPNSAQAFARWLLDSYKNPEKPLASVELLVSGKSTGKFVLPDGTVKNVQRASMANVKEAITHWQERGDSHTGNLMVFFFSGHGLAVDL